LQEQSQKNGWNYADLWDAISREEFTNTAVHISPEGNQQLAVRILPLIKEILESGAQDRQPVE